MTPEEKIKRQKYNRKHNPNKALSTKSLKPKLTNRRCQAKKGGKRCNARLPEGYFQRCVPCVIAERPVGDWE